MSSTIHPVTDRHIPIVHAPKLTKAKGSRTRRPRILLVTPELSSSRYLSRDGKQAPVVKAGGLADVRALLLDSLSDSGADVHVAMPHFRTLYQHLPERYDAAGYAWGKRANKLVLQRQLGLEEGMASPSSSTMPAVCAGPSTRRCTSTSARRRKKPPTSNASWPRRLTTFRPPSW